MLAGNADKLTLDSGAGAKTLSAYGRETANKGRAYLFKANAPSGNSGTILCGPNGRAIYPLPANSTLDFWIVDPGLMAFDSQGVASLIVNYTYGGEAPQDADQDRTPAYRAPPEVH